jgi:hypothetical protein
MNTLYPIDFHRRVDRRWAERMDSVSANALGTADVARPAGSRRSEVRHATEALDLLPGREEAMLLSHSQDVIV